MCPQEKESGPADPIPLLSAPRQTGGLHLCLLQILLILSLVSAPRIGGGVLGSRPLAPVSPTEGTGLPPGPPGPGTCWEHKDGSLQEPGQGWALKSTLVSGGQSLPSELEWGFLPKHARASPRVTEGC